MYDWEYLFVHSVFAATVGLSKSILIPWFGSQPIILANMPLPVIKRLLNLTENWLNMKENVNSEQTF